MTVRDVANRLKIAFFDFTGCEGCQLSVIDALQTCPDLLDAVEIVQFREAMSEMGADYQVAFVEGSCTTLEGESRLRLIREQAETVIALGACAHLGGVNGLLIWQSQEQAQRIVYGKMGKLHEVHSVRSIGEVIPIDGFIPGCPIDRQEFIWAIKSLLNGRTPAIPDFPVCVECKLKENLCVFELGHTCLGPVTRAGCGAICPSLGAGCVGCRGMVTNPNLTGLKMAFIDHGHDEVIFGEQMKLFQSLQYNGTDAAKVA
jgi:coenzyme F420-reducing hydrogenase gamma subunit